jgi:hypothetical protein
MNEENTQQNNVNINQILEKIKSGKVNMRPKYYFMLRLVALAVTIFITFLLSAFIVSYVIFSINAGGEINLLAFGPRGLYHFILTLPWLILVVDVLLIVFLDWLLKGFRFGYNSSILFLFVVTMVSITALATLINYTSFHRKLMRRAENNTLPIGGGFYMGIRMSHGNQGIFRGQIVSIESTSTFYMKHNDLDSDTDYHVIEVVTPQNSDVFTLFLAPGDEVFIAGDKTSTGIRAYGIRKLTAAQ